MSNVPFLFPSSLGFLIRSLCYWLCFLWPVCDGLMANPDGALDNLLVSSELWQHRNDQGTATSITLIRALSALLPVSVPSPCLSCVSMPQSEKPPPFVTGSPSHGMPCNIHIKLNSWSCAWRRLQPASPDRRPRRQDVMPGLRSKIARVCESVREFARVCESAGPGGGLSGCQAGSARGRAGTESCLVSPLTRDQPGRAICWCCLSMCVAVREGLFSGQSPSWWPSSFFTKSTFLIIS